MLDPLASGSVEELSLLGGRLCLDFVNTVDPRHSDTRADHLRDYPALLAWGRHVGILTEEQVTRLREEAARRPAEAAVVHEAAITLREALYRLFAAIAGERAPDPADLGLLNRALAATLGHARIAPQGDGYTWTWADGLRALDRVLWPVARDAAELLTAPELARVRECSGARCGWLFVDLTRNRSRRWCSMAGCGSRDKARRFYQRRRSGKGLG